VQNLICLAGVLALAAPVFAQEKKPASVTKPAEKTTSAAPAAEAKQIGGPSHEAPKPPTPGAETKALEAFTKSVTMTGKAPAGAWGPGSPEMATKGKGTCKWEVNNLWAVCELEDTMGVGKQAMTWKGHWTYGWDFAAKAYRGVMVDSWGMAMMLDGKIEGQKITWESKGEVMMMGQPTKVRFSMDVTDPKAIKFIGEHTAAGNWVVDEESVMKPAGK
jgi:hypothetical protein